MNQSEIHNFDGNFNLFTTILYDSHVLNHSEINLTEFSDIIKKQEEDRRRDAEESENRRRKERESDMEQFRKLLGNHLS